MVRIVLQYNMCGLREEEPILIKLAVFKKNINIMHATILCQLRAGNTVSKYK